MNEKEISKRFEKSSKVLKRTLLNSIGLKNESYNLLTDRYIEEMKIKDITFKYEYNDDSYTSNKLKKAREEMIYIITNETELFDDDVRAVILNIIEEK